MSDDNKKEIKYTVNDEPQNTVKEKLTPVQIMQHAGIDPTKNYLIKIKHDNEQKSFKDEPDKELEIHENEKFITNFFGPKPVS
jgi:hypothetical protein